MLKIITTLSLFLLLPHLVAAGELPIAFALLQRDEIPPVRIVLPADYLAIPLTIQSSASDPVQRTDELQRALQAITRTVQATAGLSSYGGPVAFTTNIGYASGKLFSKGSRSVEGAASAELYLLSALNENSDIFVAAKRIYQNIDLATFPETIQLRFGDSRLAVINPERVRPDLLAKIAEYSSATKWTLGTAGVAHINNLESRVSVVQIDARDVALFIDYKLQFHSQGTR